MALQHLRSSTANKRPTPAGMSDGQLALNTNDASPGLFFKDSNGALVKVGPVHVGTTAPNATPGSGGSSGNAIGEQWLDTTGGTYVFKVWDGSAWRSESGTFVDVNGDVMTGALGIIAGSAGSPGLYFSGDTNTGLYSPGADQVAISTGGSGRLFVNASGNIGVGANNAQNYSGFTNVAINGTQGGAIDLCASAVGVGSNRVAQLSGINGGSFVLATGAADTMVERLRITSAGLVGVGTSSPSYTIDVNGTARFNGSTVINGSSLDINPSSGQPNITLRSGNTFRGYIEGNSSGGLTFGSGPSATTAMTIDSSQRVGVGTTTVDKLLTLNDTLGATLALKTGANTSSSIHGLEFYDRQGTASFPSSPGQLTSYVRSERNGGNAEFSLTFGTTNSTSANASERLRIDSSGRVGIGVSSPGALLHIAEVAAGSGFSSTSLRSTRSNFGAEFTGYIDQGVSHGAIISTVSAGTATERIRITDAGRVGIGTTSPGHALDVVGNINAVDTNGTRIGFKVGDTFTASTTAAHYGLTFGAAGANTVGLSGYDGLAFYNRGQERFRCDSSGRLLVGTSSARTNFFNTVAGTQLQVEGTTYQSSSLSLVATGNNSYDAGTLVLGKGRGNAVGSNTIVQNGTPPDILGYISFQGNDGSEFVEGASIKAEVDGGVGANDLPSRLVFSVTRDGQASPTEAMRITSNGQLGAFTAAANDALYVSSGEGAGTTYRTIQARYGATGNFGGTISFNVFTNGNVQNTNNSYGALSDIKLKENIVNATSQWSDIKALQVRKYNFKEGQTHTQIGLVAQEVELVSPGLVTESPDRDAEGNDLGTVTKSVNYSVLYMKAVKALQEAMERIEQLEQRLAAAGI